MTLTFPNIIELLLRCLGQPRKVFGTLTIKFQRGEVKHIAFEESFDLESLKLSTIRVGDKKMFTKYGAKTAQDPDSSTIISEVEVDENNTITKENSLKKEEPEEKKEEVVSE